MPADLEIAITRQMDHELACPSMFGVLRLDEGGSVCAGCGRAYPVVDGIPVLIAEHDVEAAQ